MHTCPGVNDRKKSTTKMKKSDDTQGISAANTTDHSNYCTDKHNGTQENPQW